MTSNKITHILKRVVSFAVIGCTFMSLTACSDTTWAYKAGDATINSGLYISQTMAAYASAGSHRDINADIEDLFKQKLDGKPAKQWIIDEAKKTSAGYVAVSQKFAELGLTLTDEDKAEIQQTTQSSWAAVSPFYVKNGVGEKTYYLMNQNYKMREMIFTKYYDKGGIEEVPDDDIIKYFKENYVSVNLLGVKLETGDELTAEQKTKNEEAKKSAQKIVDRINKDKKTFNEAKSEYQKLENEGKAEEDKIDTAVKPDKETRVFVPKNSTNPSEKIVTAIFDDTKIDGEAVLLTDDNAYYIIMRYNVMDDKTQFEEKRETLLNELKSGDFTTVTDGWTEAVLPSLVANAAAIKRYDPKNIDFSY